MFEKASEIRAAYREKLVRRATEKGMQKGREKGREEYGNRLREAYERFGVEQDGVVVLPRTAEVEQFLFSLGGDSGRPYY